MEEDNKSTERNAIMGKPMRYWRSSQNRRLFFDKIASDLHFNPLIPDNWYSFDPSNFLRYKVSSFSPIFRFLIYFNNLATFYCIVVVWRELEKSTM